MPLAPVIVPPVDPAIFNPNDLYNDSYGWAPDAAWNAETFDRIAWLQEAIPFTVVGWATPFSEAAGPGGVAHRGPTHMLISLPDGIRYEVNMLAVCGFDPRVAYYEIYAVANKKGAAPIPPYPGYLVRHPVGGDDPVGEPWPEHGSNAQNRKVFRVSPAFSTDKWPYTLDPNTGRGTEFLRSDGRYTLKRDYTPGPGMWGGGGTYTYRWEKDYSR